MLFNSTSSWNNGSPSRLKELLKKVPYLQRTWRGLRRALTPVPNPVPDMGRDLPGVKPLNLEFRKMPKGKWHLNVLLPSLALKHMSGGPNTALHLTYRLARAGIPIRYLSVNHPLDANLPKLWNHIHSLTGIKERFPHVEFADACNPAVPVEVGEDDVFFGTAWWTVQNIKSILSRAKVKEFLYLIQDYEPGLYPWSSPFALAQETYDLPFYAMVNEESLLRHLIKEHGGRFTEKEFIANHCVVFNPAVDRTFFYPEPKEPGQRKRLVFYARPHTAPRNLFELGLAALKAVGQSQRVSPTDWEITSIGDPVPPIKLGSGLTLSYVPWAGYEQYARFLRQGDVGLSLMLSPHTSYPPLEMAACGMTVVTTPYSTKTPEALGKISANLISALPTVEALAAGILAGMDRSNDWPARLAGSSLNLPSTWDDSLEPLVPKIIEMIQRCRQGAEDTVESGPGFRNLEAA